MRGVVKFQPVKTKRVSAPLKSVTLLQGNRLHKKFSLFWYVRDGAVIWR